MNNNNSNGADLLVLGAGPGGYAAAFLAADVGMKVTMVDPKENPGGVCLYHGCIPTKALLRAVKLKKEMEGADKLGVLCENLSIDIGKLLKFKNSVVEKLTGGLGQLTKRRKINYIRGKARFTGASAVEITDEKGNRKELSFQRAVIATGTRAASIPGVELDGKKVLYAKPALDIENVPDTLLVIGAGFIGLELATLYSHLGSDVTVAEMLPGVLPGADRDLVKMFLKENKNTFTEILTNTRVDSVENKDDRLQVVLKDTTKGSSETKNFNTILLAVGRKPNTEYLDPGKAGVAVDEKGYIPVNRQRLTENENIFAVGDVTGPPLLAHKAHLEGRVAAAVAAGKKEAYDPAAIPSVEYTDPEIAWAGLTEDEAKQKGIKYSTTSFPWGASGRAATLGIDSGKTKLIIESDTERILGVGIVGEHADELIPEAVLAIEMAALASDISKTVHPHPTLSETLMEAADAYYGTATDIFNP